MMNYFLSAAPYNIGHDHEVFQVARQIVHMKYTILQNSCALKKKTNFPTSSCFVRNGLDSAKYLPIEPLILQGVCWVSRLTDVILLGFLYDPFQENPGTLAYKWHH